MSLGTPDMKSSHAFRTTCFWVALLLPTAALLGVARSHHAFLVLSHYLHGRAGDCTLAESFEGEALSRLQLENVNAVRAASRVTQKDERYSLWSTPFGKFWTPTASGDALVYDLAEQKRNIYGTRIRPGDIVLDAGANVGVFTRKALWAGAAKVIAIEPAPENLECLRRNFAAEIADGRVVLYPKGVWDKEDVLKLRVDPNDSAKDTFVRQIENAQFIEAPLTTIDKMVEELRLTKVDFIKMDIEGAEQKAVVGARNTLAKFRPRMALCIYHVKGDETMVPKLVHEAVSDYTVTKTCLCAQNGIQPEVAFFY
jgi:FkbM family methyltransferase